MQLVVKISAIFIFVIGLLLGAVSWAVSPLLSGQFEPFDSGLAMFVGQAILSTFVGYIGFRHGFWNMALAILGAYLGQVVYWYTFGNSEARAWIVLGAFTTLFLCVIPALSGTLGVVARHVRKRKCNQED